MNSPASRQGNMVRYAVYLVGYLMAFGAFELARLGGQVHLWGVILFSLVALMILIFYAYRFNREERFFETNEYQRPWLNNYLYIILMTIVIVAIQIGIHYLQAKNFLPQFMQQISYLKTSSESLFWFEIVARGIILSSLQQFLTIGFLFNYGFRASTIIEGLVGMAASGVFFTILNFQPSLGLLIVNFILGMIFAWSYLYTQSILMPIYLASLSGVLMVIMF